MIRNLKEFRADVEVAGQTREVTWKDGTVSVHGVTSFIEVAEILHMLQTGQVTEWSAKDFLSPQAPPPATPKPQTQHNAPEPARTAPQPPKLSRGNAESVLPPTPPTAPVSTPDATEGTAPSKGASEAPSTPANGKAPSLAAFGRVSRLGEVVDLAVQMGKAGTFDDLQAFVQELMDSEMCPILEQKVQENGGAEGFWDRMRVLAQSKKIPGALGTA